MRTTSNNLRRLGTGLIVRVWTGLVLALVALLPAPASAERLPGGVVQGPVLGSASYARWVDANGWLLAGSHTEPYALRCGSFDEPGQYQGQPLTMPTFTEPRSGSFVAHHWTTDAQGRLLVVSDLAEGGLTASGLVTYPAFAVVRFDDCQDTTPEVLYRRHHDEPGQLPAGVEMPPATTWEAPLPLDDDGWLYLPTRSGDIYRFDTVNPSAPELWLSLDAIEAGLRGGRSLEALYPWVVHGWGHEDLEQVLGVRQIHALVRGPDGAPWAILRQLVSPPGTWADWLLRFDPETGEVTVLLSAEENLWVDELELLSLADLRAVPALDGAYVAHKGEHVILQIGAQGELRRHLLYSAQHHERFPQGGPPIEHLFTGAGDRIFAGGATGSSVTQIHELSLDELTFDLDDDGLSRAQERDLGLDDDNPDLDGDGALDGAEAQHFGTDPRDAASHPPRPEQEWAGLAPSNLIMDWPLFLRSGWADPRGEHLGALCSYTQSDVGIHAAQCLSPQGADLLPEGNEDFAFFSGDLRHMWLLDSALSYPLDEDGPGSPVSDQWFPALRARSPQPVHAFYAFAAGAGYAFADLGDEILRRVEGLDAAMVDVVDVDRQACRVAHTQADVDNGCDTAAFPWLADAWAQAALGMDVERERVLVGLRGPHPFHSYFGLGKDRFGFVGNGRHGVDGAHVLREIPGTDAWAAVSSQSTSSTTVQLVDETLRPLTTANPGPELGGDFPWFAEGFLDRRLWVFTSEPFGGGNGFAVNLGGAVFGNPGWPPCTHIGAFTHRQWVPVPLGVQPGEAIVFAGASLLHGGSPCGSHPINFQPGHPTPSRDDWALWRISREGGALRWLDGERFGALVEDEALRLQLVWAARLGQSNALEFPLAPIEDIAASPDGRRLCLVERERSRLWELLLDAEGVPDLVRLVHQGDGPVACGYDGMGRLGWIGAEPSVAHLPDLEQPVALGAGPMQHLLWVDGRWLALDDAGTMRCVDAAGSVSESHGGLLDVALTPDGFATVLTHSGHLYRLPAADLCEASPVDAGETLLFTDAARSTHTTDTSLWDRLYNDVDEAIWQGDDRPGARWGGIFLHNPLAEVAQASLAVRSDGLVLISLGDTTPDDIAAHRVVWRVRPSLTPVGWPGHRFAQLDAQRTITIPEHRIMSAEMQRVGGMAMVPWSEASEDRWRWFGAEPQPLPPPDPTPSLDGVDALPSSGDGGERSDGDCGCTTTAPGSRMPLALMSLTVMMGLVLRRRAR